MNKHTPGPWLARTKYDDPDSEWEVCFEDDKFRGEEAWSIAEVYPHAAFEQSAEANARLIAAAPDMLVALKELNLLIDFSHKEGIGVWMFDDTTDISAAMDLAKDAIAKAEGRDP